jgi:hypothetical protein
LFGQRTADAKSPNVSAYATALSFCTQHIWGSWNGGAYDGHEALPAANRKAWPSRTLFVKDCTKFIAPPREPYVTLYGDPEA